MNEDMENNGFQHSKPTNNPISNNLNNLTIKQISFGSQNDQLIFRPKTLKPNLPTKIYHHGYYKTQTRNKKMLPELGLKPISQGKYSDDDKNNAMKERTFARSTIRNSRNSEILNSLIQILKNDPDASTNSSKTRNARTKTQPSMLNEFLQSRQISSVKNSRGPKLINNQIMMLANHNGYRRKLVSEQKTRPKIQGEDNFSVSKLNYKKDNNFDEMELTFYKPGRMNIMQNANMQRMQRNQFIDQSS